MAVHPASLEVLEKANVPPAQARAIVQAIEIEIAGAEDTLATKHDILTLRHDTKQDILTLGQDILTLRHDTKQDILMLRHEMAEMRAELRYELQAALTGNLRHMYGAIMGQFALLLGLAYFFVTHTQR